MFKSFSSALMITAFLSAQISPLGALAQEQAQTEEEFRKGVEELQRQVDIEQQKIEEARLIKEYRLKQKQLREEAKGEAVVLAARLNELEYLSDFLGVDAQAKQSVENALEEAKESEPTTVDTLAVSTVLTLGLSGVYVLANQKKVVADRRPVEKVRPNTTHYKPGATGRALNYVRGEPGIAKVAGYASLGAALITAVILTDYLVVYNRNAEKVDNLEGIYLSRLVSNGQLDYLNRADVSAALTEKSKDKAFGDALVLELDAILKEAEAKAVSIRAKGQEVADLESKINQLKGKGAVN